MTASCESEALRVAHRADVHAEPLVDRAVVAERQLRAAAARVEHRERPVRGLKPGADRLEREAALLLAGDHLDLDAGPLGDRPEDRVPVARHPQAGRADGGDRQDVEGPGLLGHPLDGRHGPLEGGGADGPGRFDPLAQPRQLGSVDEGAPAIVRALGDMELDGVGAAVEHGVALGCARQDAGETRGVGGIEVVGEAKRANLVRHGPRVFALDGKRPGGQLVRDHVRDLRRAAVRGIPDAPLVHGHGPDPPGWPGELAQELVERPGIPIKIGDGHVERGRTRAPRSSDRSGTTP